MAFDPKILLDEKGQVPSWVSPSRNWREYYKYLIESGGGSIPPDIRQRLTGVETDAYALKVYKSNVPFDRERMVVFSFIISDIVKWDASDTDPIVLEPFYTRIRDSSGVQALVIHANPYQAMVIGVDQQGDSFFETECETRHEAIENRLDALEAEGPTPGPQGPAGPQGIQGEAGTVGTIKGSYATLAELQAAHSTGEPGDFYYINPNLWVWDSNSTAWVNIGQIAGPQGIQGVQGEKGDKGDPGTSLVEPTADGKKYARVYDGSVGTWQRVYEMQEPVVATWSAAGGDGTVTLPQEPHVITDVWMMNGAESPIYLLKADYTVSGAVVTPTNPAFVDGMRIKINYTA